MRKKSVNFMYMLIVCVGTTCKPSPCLKSWPNWACGPKICVMYAKQFSNIFLHTSIAACNKNPFRRTSEHNHRYNYLKFSFILLKYSGYSLIDFDVMLQIQSSEFIKSLNFGSNLKRKMLNFHIQLDFYK